MILDVENMLNPHMETSSLNTVAAILVHTSLPVETVHREIVGFSVSAIWKGTITRAVANTDLGI